MSRYLTPSKICLLLLVQLYRDGSIPMKSAIHVLSFISGQTGRRPSEQGTRQPPRTTPSLDDLERLLTHHQSRVAGRSLHDRFLELLWGLHDLVTFTTFLQDQIAVTISPPGEDKSASTKLVCSPTSPIGQFTRRCHLESVRLQFSDVYQLWEDFVLFREPSKAAYRIRNPDFPDFENISNAASVNLLVSKQPFVSTILLDRIEKGRKRSETPSSLDDIEKIMHFQLGQLQKYGSRVPAQMKDGLRAMIEEGMSVPSDMHFIK